MSCLDRIELAELFNIYQPVLAKRQKEIGALYYLDDLSISEIAENLSLTRAAVHTALKTIRQSLLTHEEALKVRQKQKAILEICNDTKKEKNWQEEIIKILL